MSHGAAERAEAIKPRVEKETTDTRGHSVLTLRVLLMSGLILYETDNIVRGGETNYVMATVTLFVSIFNLFTSLLHLLGFASND